VPYLVTALASRLLTDAAATGVGGGTVLVVAFLADYFLPPLLASLSLHAGQVNS